jgi:myosin heavy subunit
MEGAMEEKKGLTGIIVGVAVLFVVGIGIGYFIWGVERQEKPDYTKYLSKTIDHIKSIEKANVALTEKTGALQTNITKLQDDLKVDPRKLEKQIDKLNLEVEKLKKENASLVAAIKNSDESLSEMVNMESELQQLMKKMETLTIEKDALQTAVNESVAIFEENDRLKGTIQNLMDDLAASKSQIEAIQKLVTPEMKMQLPVTPETEIQQPEQ